MPQFSQLAVILKFKEMVNFMRVFPIKIDMKLL